MMISSTLILNQICRQVTSKIGPNKSNILSNGLSFPPDITDLLIWEYFLPDFWVWPWNLQQDICLLKTGELHKNDCISVQVHDASCVKTFKPLALGDDHYFVVEFNEGSRSDTREGWELHKQVNWSKVKILNHMRSFVCPVLFTEDLPEPDSELDSDLGPTNEIDFMVMRELTEDDVKMRGIGDFACTRERDKILLEEALDQIILNDQEIELNLLGESREEANDRMSLDGTDVNDVIDSPRPNMEKRSHKCLIWYPRMKGTGSIIFTQRE